MARVLLRLLPFSTCLRMGFFHTRRLELFSRVPPGEIFHFLLKESKLFEQPTVGSAEWIGHCRIFLLSEWLPLGQFECFHSRLVSTSHSRFRLLPWVCANGPLGQKRFLRPLIQPQLNLRGTFCCCAKRRSATELAWTCFLHFCTFKTTFANASKDVNSFSMAGKRSRSTSSWKWQTSGRTAMHWAALPR